MRLLFTKIFPLHGLVLFFLVTPVVAQSASQVIQDAVKKSSQGNVPVSTIIQDVERAAAKANASNQRSLYSFLGSLTEQLGRYEEAAAWYARAAGIAASPAPGTVNFTSEELVLAAVRCSLSCGNNQQADSYLSSVKNSSVAETAAYAKLYSVWSWLCRVSSSSDLSEPVATLEGYTVQDSMKLVRPPVYLTLWYLTGENKWARKLQQEYPKSAETAIVTGAAQMLPSPFWFFLPRGSDAHVATSSGISNSGGKSSSSVENKGKTSDEDIHVVVKQQVGFFRSRENAENLAKRVRDAGFKPEISEEQRQSGTIYFVVTVPEDKDNSTGLRLKTAGFECYPVFADEEY